MDESAFSSVSSYKATGPIPLLCSILKQAALNISRPKTADKRQQTDRGGCGCGPLKPQHLSFVSSDLRKTSDYTSSDRNPWLMVQLWTARE